MNDDHLRHLVKLGVIYVQAIQETGYADSLIDLSPKEARDTHVCLSILAEAFVELARRQGMLPTFKVPASPSCSKKDVA